MRKIVFLLALALPFFGRAQNIGIGTSTPDASAMLDIASTTKGLLIPRMSTTERTSITSPAVGLVVFDNTTASFWVYRGDVNGGWRELLTDLNKHWDILGSHIYNTNNGNVGIGTNTPAQKLTINDINPGILMMNDGTPVGQLSTNGSDLKMFTSIGNMTGRIVFNTVNVDRMVIRENGFIGIGFNVNPVSALTIGGYSPSLQLQDINTNIGFFQVANNTSNLRIGTNSTNTTGKLIMQTRQVDRITIDENGLVGIGTGTPVSPLTINGTNASLQMQHNGINRGIVQALGTDLVIGTNSTNTTGNLLFQTKQVDRMTIDQNGNTGIGTITPGSILTINDVDPILQLRNGDVDKGFVQVVSNDMKIGTNISNTLGKFVIRTAGADRVEVDGSGNMSSFGNITVEKTNPRISFTDPTGTSLISFSNSTKDLTIQKTSLGGGSLVLRADGGLGSTTLNLTTSGLLNFGTGLNPATYKFSVEGKVIATDFTALPVGSWPDYVFENDYRLRSLAEVKQFIDVNKHLPNIPPASQIEKEGIQLGDMSKRLIEKVEELTLYIIQLQEQVDTMKKKMEAIQH